VDHNQDSLSKSSQKRRVVFPLKPDHFVYLVIRSSFWIVLLVILAVPIFGILVRTSLFEIPSVLSTDFSAMPFFVLFPLFFIAIFSLYAIFLNILEKPFPFLSFPLFVGALFAVISIGYVLLVRLAL
jgi:hypothetical protein